MIPPRIPGPARPWTWFAAGFAAIALVGPEPSTAQETTPDASKVIPQAEVVRISTERAPFDPTLSGRNVAFWEGLTRKNPKPYLELRELAGAYLARQRELGDIADAVRAEEAARKSLTINTRGNSGAAIRLAQAMLAQHRFPEALAMAQAAAKVDSKAERIVIDIQLELGKYDDATRALQTITSEPDDLNLLALRSRFEDIEGKPEASIQSMREAMKITEGRPDMPAEVVAWYHTMVGHHLIDSGHLEDGELACREALVIFPNDYRAMTGLAEAATWRGDHAGALKWSLDAIKLSPQNPEALKLAGDAYAAMGKTQEADAQFKALRDLAHSFPRIYDRHWVMFCCDTDQNLDEALALARKDLELRQDIQGHETLAWACYKKGLLEEADREMTLALSRGTMQAPLMYHAAVIAKARGDEARSKTLMDKARTLNPYLVKAAETPAR